jgi:hypothetical protein
VALELAGKLELQQHGAHDGRRHAGQADQIVQRDRARPEQIHDLRALADLRIALDRLGIVFAKRKPQRPLHDRRDRIDDVGGLCHQRRALLDQIVGAGGARIERRARHGEYLAALFGRHARRDQRSGAVRGFDHDDAKGRGRDQTVSPRKIPRARLVAERHFGDRRTFGAEDRVQQLVVLRRA